MITLSQYHTFALPAQAQQLVEINNASQLREIDWSSPFCLLGEGSNTVFLQDFQGQVIHINIKGVEINETEDSYSLSVAAGENWHQLVVYCLANHIYGFENLALIPGTVGAAPVQNIGAYGLEVKDLISEVRGYNIESGEIERLSKEDCKFAYRDSIFKGAFKNKFIITEVVFRITKHWQPNISYGPLQKLVSPSAQQVFDEVVRIRSSKLPNPKENPNAGSFFKNPIITSEQASSLRKLYPNMPSYYVDEEYTKLAAGWLIEQAGLKGHQLGGIAVSEKQALVIINACNGSSDELLALIRLIQHKVNKLFDINLEHEVRLIGAHGEITVEVS